MELTRAPMQTDVTSVAAFICQQVLRDQDDLLSAIRILDTITVRAVENAGAALTDLFAVALVKSSATQNSKRQMSVELITPSGGTTSLGSSEVCFESDKTDHPVGATMIIEIHLSITEAGLHRVNLYLEDSLIPSIPLTLRIETVATL